MGDWCPTTEELLPEVDVKNRFEDAGKGVAVLSSAVHATAKFPIPHGFPSWVSMPAERSSDVSANCCAIKSVGTSIKGAETYSANRVRLAVRFRMDS